MAAYGAYLERHHPGYKLIDMAPIAKHYFSEIGVRSRRGSTTSRPSALQRRSRG